MERLLVLLEEPDGLGPNWLTREANNMEVYGSWCEAQLRNTPRGCRVLQFAGFKDGRRFG